MRELPGGVDQGARRQVTQPRYLVELQFDPVERHSTAGEITWDGVQWTAGAQVRVERVTANGGRISLANDGDAADGFARSQRLLEADTADVPVRVYKHYEGDAFEVMRGFISTVQVGQRITLDVVGTASDRSKVPRTRFTPANGFNYLPNPESTVNWAGIVFKFEAPASEL